MRAVAALTCLFGADAVHAQMYKCVDARGVTAYSDKACPGGKGKEVDIHGQPPISGELTPNRQDLKAAERDFQRREALRERERQADAKAMEVRKRRCTTLRAELERASSVRNPADSVAHDARLTRLNSEIARTCL